MFMSLEPLAHLEVTTKGGQTEVKEFLYKSFGAKGVHPLGRP